MTYQENNPENLQATIKTLVEKTVLDPKKRARVEMEIWHLIEQNAEEWLEGEQAQESDTKSKYFEAAGAEGATDETENTGSARLDWS